MPQVWLCPPWAALLPPAAATLAAWERGLALHSAAHGAFCLHADQMKALQLYDGDSMAKVSEPRVWLEIDDILQSKTFKAIGSR